MGILSDKRIIEKIYDENISIEPFMYDHVQPASIDLTLGSVIKSPKKNVKKIIDTYENQEEFYDEHKISEHTLLPGDFIVSSVREKIKIPADISGFIQNRSSLARLGLDVSASSYVNPGYCGRLTITVKNNNMHAVKLHSGMRICQLVLMDVEPKASTDYGMKSDAKYHGEQGGELTKLYLDKEFQEYIRKGKEGLSISDFLEQRLEGSIQNILTDAQKKSLGLR
mgnify:CR=1 FL=1